MGDWHGYRDGCRCLTLQETHEPQEHDLLRYGGGAVDAATFYAEILPDSAVGAVLRAPGDYPDGKQGDVLTVEFTVAGIPCLGLNGGPHFKHNEAFVSNRDGRPGRNRPPVECDRRQWRPGKRMRLVQGPLGHPWQITPRALTAAICDPDRAAAKRAFEAMMTMKKIDIATIEAARLGRDRSPS